MTTATIAAVLLLLRLLIDIRLFFRLVRAASASGSSAASCCYKPTISDKQQERMRWKQSSKPGGGGGNAAFVLPNEGNDGSGGGGGKLAATTALPAFDCPPNPDGRDWPLGFGGAKGLHSNGQPKRRNQCQTRDSFLQMTVVDQNRNRGPLSYWCYSHQLPNSFGIRIRTAFDSHETLFIKET